MHRPAALIVVLLGAIIIAGAAFVISCSHSGQDPNTVAANEGPPLAARVDQLDGTAGIAAPSPTPAPTQGQTGPQTESGWTKAGVNTPVSVGSRLYTRESSKLGIAFSGRNYARLNQNTSLDVLSLSQRRTQLALRDGSCIFSVGALAPEELFEVGTPNGAIDFTQPGLYQVGIDDGGNALVSCLSGTAQVVGLGGSGEVTKGQLLTLAAAAASEAIVSQLAPTVAGSICNDYYSYRYPSTYDGRYADYNRYLDDPYYYDPYRRSVSYQYIPDDSEVAGLDDLDRYGDWSDLQGYGHCWRPREAAGWVPYRDGSWSDDRALGLTWVANERWGWAPYHYGRWAHVNEGWYWVPAEVVSQPVYAPALVAFVQMPEPDRVGWLPLGPGDPYVPRYYDREYRPQYIGSTTVVNKYVNITNITNYNVPGAVTVVRTTEFTGVITPAIAQTVDPAVLGRTRPVMDPFAVASVRELAPNMMAVRPRVEVPVGAEQSLSRPVVISQTPVVPTVAASTVQALKVQPVSEDVRKRKLEVKQTAQPVVALRPDGVPIAPVPAGQPQAGPNAQVGPNAQEQQLQMATQQRQARMAQLAPQAAQGNKAAKQEMRQLQEDQRVQDKAARKAAAQGQQGTAGQPATPGQPGSKQGQPGQSPEQRKAQKQAERQQAQQAQQGQQQAEQQRQAQAAQLAAQQKAQKQAARQQAQQQAQQAAAQQQQQRQQAAEQRKTQKQAQQQAAGQQADQAQQQRQQAPEQRKAQKQAQRQAAGQQADQAQQQRQQAAEQRKAQKQAQRQAAGQQADQPQQQQRQQQKAQRKAAQQQQEQQQTEPSKAEKKAKNKNSGER
jgi:hypothetical protein